ncbi:MAG: ferritin-like domain-containing protein [Anaerolineae bacterium]|nr:ferritin-like domain-containing protein [Anaerolineae bacterium]
MAKLSNAELIRMLQAAAKDEHAAIIQYLRHAYLMGEGELACEIEGIAREEMRHFWMLSRWIVKLGGEPTITRGFTDLDGVTVPDWMRRDVAAEDRAIAMYTNYLTKIEDPDLRADIEHILADEERHNGDFTHFVEKAEAELLAEAGSEEEMAEIIAAIDEEALNWGVGHEYAALLQYLMHSFKLHQTDEEVSSQLEMQAINEMQHFGWFGEGLADHGKEMPLEHHGVTLPAKMREMLEADVQLEQETSAMYAEYLTRMENEELKGVVDDARGQELYHESLFSRLLKRADDLAEKEASETPKPSRPSWTIGTLKKGE